MRDIVVNGRFLSRPITGVERYGRELLHYIDDCTRVERPVRSLNGWMGHAWEQFILPRRIRPESVLWSPANTGPWLVRNQVLTIHDLSPLEHPEWFRAGFAAWYRLLLPVLARRVRRVLVPSASTQRRVTSALRLPAEKVRIVPGGVDASRFRPVSVSHGVGRYILFVGSLEPRKNLQGLLAAWARSQERHPELTLVIAGAAGRSFHKLPALASADRTRWIGYVRDADLPGLYSGAELFVLPSLDEGFGLTALEAMACSAPVLVSDGGALPEVVGEAGLVFSLSDPMGLDNSLDAILSDPPLRASLKEKGPRRARQFSWRRAAEMLLENLNEI